MSGKQVGDFIETLVNTIVNHGNSLIPDTDCRMEWKTRRIAEGCWMVLDIVIVRASVGRGTQESEARFNSSRRSGSSCWPRQAKFTPRPA